MVAIALAELQYQFLMTTELIGKSIMSFSTNTSRQASLNVHDQDTVLDRLYQPSPVPLLAMFLFVFLCGHLSLFLSPSLPWRTDSNTSLTLLLWVSNSTVVTQAGSHRLLYVKLAS